MSQNIMAMTLVTDGEILSFWGGGWFFASPLHACKFAFQHMVMNPCPVHCYHMPDKIVSFTLMSLRDIREKDSLCMETNIHSLAISFLQCRSCHGNENQWNKWHSASMIPVLPNAQKNCHNIENFFTKNQTPGQIWTSLVIQPTPSHHEWHPVSNGRHHDNNPPQYFSKEISSHHTISPT